MKKNITLSIFTLLYIIPWTMNAQSTGYLGGQSATGIQMNTQSYGVVTQFDLSESFIEGDTYLNKDWYIGDIITSKNDTLLNMVMKFDLENEWLVLNTAEGYKQIILKHIENFNWGLPNGEKERYFNTQKYFSKYGLGGGITEEIAKGEVYALVSKPHVKLMEGNYVRALDAGDDTKKYVVKEYYYIISRDELIPLKGGRKKIAEAFEDREEEIALWMKQNGNKGKNEKDFLALFNYLEQ